MIVRPHHRRIKSSGPRVPQISGILNQKFSVFNTKSIILNDRKSINCNAKSTSTLYGIEVTTPAEPSNSSFEIIKYNICRTKSKHFNRKSEDFNTETDSSIENQHYFIDLVVTTPRDVQMEMNREESILKNQY